MAAAAAATSTPSAIGDVVRMCERKQISLQRKGAHAHHRRRRRLRRRIRRRCRRRRQT